MDLVETSLQSLEWPRFLAVYADHCYSLPGRDLALALTPAQSAAAAEQLLSLTQEAIKVIEKESYSSLGDLPSSSLAIERLSKEQILDAKELVGLQRLLEICGTVKDQIEKQQKSALGLFAMLSMVDPLPDQRKSLAATLEPDGRVKDSASPKLRSLRSEEGRLHNEARERLDQVLQKAFRDGHLQDRFFDVRDGRYLIPVKTEHRHKVSGFVMESSHTKATVFVEPAAVREINDRLKQVQLDIQEEIYAILCALCEKLFPVVDQLGLNYSQILNFELTLGRARHAQSLASARGSSKPEFSKDIYLEGLYHPLLPLVLKAENIVRNGFILDKGQRILVISGPNTGGKTVILKAVGLSALMARCGFYVACAGEAKLPFFTNVVAQIGDAQSIEQSLSSFSASVANLLEIIRVAGPQTLILIDEIFHSTDPDEAAALSQAILHYFHDLGSTAIVTTHLNGLKVAHSERFGNASMEFSSDTMRPTYRLRMGIPGSSRAIEIAQHLGLPENLALEARGLLGQNQQRYDELLNTLEDRERRLADALEKLAKEEEHVLAEKEKAAKLHEQLKDERQKFQVSAREKLRDQEREATQKLEAIILEYKTKLQDLNQKQDAALEAKQKVKELKESFAPKEEISSQAAQESTDESLSLADGFELRGLVYVQHLKNQGTLLSDPTDRRKPAEVQVGTLRMRVDWDKLTPLTKKGKPMLRKAAASVQDTECAPELNVIGKTVEDAMMVVEDYVDRGSRSGRPSIRIVHGHGSGALRNAVRTYLRKCSYSIKFRPGGSGEGGEGCTVIEFER